MDEASLRLDRIYAETCSNIRATDDISFKLMGTVPLVSSVALLTLFFKEPIPPANGGLIVALSLFAAIITLGLFRWELRNIQICSWLLRRAEIMERVVAPDLQQRPEPPHCIGKTGAEKWVYSVTIISWLSIPVVLSPSSVQGWLLWTYRTGALLVLLATALSARADVRVRAKSDKVLSAAGDKSLVVRNAGVGSS